jgi:hypothetical protein
MNLAEWWEAAARNADWIAAIASFLATVLGAVLAAWIALRIQNNDFRARKVELEEQAAKAAAQRGDDWRRATVSRAFAVLEDAAILGVDPYSQRMTLDMVKHEAESMRMEFRLDSAEDGWALGDWFVRKIDNVLQPHDAPQLRGEHVKGLTAGIRFDLYEWAAGRVSSASFVSK